ncbi:coatomer zeta subunit [Schizosaccharomyces cryophilus OY26]|uniref:Coatomer subunit zeta n=1 Tax=Schizosaccharomyces cryophilus (strain OY26 / ATCC MYA-4695 / CBS 11777 / NBRC 106824 / NRRL Y48691) TaxID=653667 RepID=S9X2C1_SCHCR|nr:coatomer zeta subunit [Schizosaccharomyces cryophilus OY26]EPY51252.1 coatomer zeta subunit [Schizosaccharomyces cryophilus OY26]
MNLSLYAVNAFLILDSTGKRIFAKYYSPPHTKEGEGSIFQSVKEEKTFEKGLFEKTWKTQNDISTYDGKLVVMLTVMDVAFYIVGGMEENEIMLYECLRSIRDALELIYKYIPDKRTILDNYDQLLIVVDETIDDGIILESEPAIIASRVTKGPVSEAQAIVSDFKEMGFMSGLQKARDKFAETILKGSF